MLIFRTGKKTTFRFVELG